MHGTTIEPPGQRRIRTGGVPAGCWPPGPEDGVLVVGITGAGKTTFARALAERRGLRRGELDALAIGPGWSERPSFLAELDALTAQPGWVLDSYLGDPRARELVWPRVTLVVWLDLPLAVTATRTLRRSLRRSWRREPVFGGNLETWRSWGSVDHPLWSSVRGFRARRRTVQARVARFGPAVVRVRRPAQVSALLRR